MVPLPYLTYLSLTNTRLKRVDIRTQVCDSKQVDRHVAGRKATTVAEETTMNTNDLSLTISAEDAAAATAERANFNDSPVPAGEYDMMIGSKNNPVIRIGKTSGKAYLRLMLQHTGETKGANVFVNLTTTDIGRKQFAQLLASLSLPTVGSSWGPIEGAEVDEKGNIPAQVTADGSSVDLGGRIVRVYLKLRQDATFGDKNEVANFKASL